MKELVLGVVSHNFRPEFINRIDEVVVFHPLGEQHIASIAQIQLKRLYKRLEERGDEIHISDEALKLLSENGYDPVYGVSSLETCTSSRSKTRWHSKYCLGELVPANLASKLMKTGLSLSSNDKTIPSGLVFVWR